MDSIKRVSHRINRLRETLPGLPYQSPPDQSDKLDPFAPDAAEAIAADLEEADEDALATQLMADYAGISPFLAREIAVRAVADAENPANGLRPAWRAIFGAADAGAFEPVYIAPRKGMVPAAYPFPTVQIDSAAQEPAASLSFALDDAYQIQIETTQFTAQLNDLRSRIDREIKRLTKQKQSVERNPRGVGAGGGTQAERRIDLSEPVENSGGKRGSRGSGTISTRNCAIKRCRSTRSFRRRRTRKPVLSGIAKRKRARTSR